MEEADEGVPPAHAAGAWDPNATSDSEGAFVWDALPDYSAREFGDYLLLHELGRGGMGVVYLARQKSLNRQVALKFIQSPQFASGSQRERFRREAELVAGLRHPNIITIFEVGEYDGAPYYAMEYIEGNTLKELVGGKPLPWKEAVRYAARIAEAIDFAHRKGVIHRDLKPHNIMVDSSDNLRVTDFGLARDQNVESGLTVTGAALGTPNYMAPEQARADEASVGPWTDVYAIGAILYEMLTSIPPIRGGSMADILENLNSVEPLNPRLINATVPRDLGTVCLKCLQKRPEQRYRTCKELAEDLERVLQDEPVRAKPVGAWERGIRWARRNQALTAVLAGSGALLVVLTAVSMLILNERRVEAEAARVQAEQNARMAEAERQRAEEAKNQAENLRLQAEESRRQAEAHLRRLRDQEVLAERALASQAEVEKQVQAMRRGTVEERIQAAWQAFQTGRLEATKVLVEDLALTHADHPDVIWLQTALLVVEFELARALAKARAFPESRRDPARARVLQLLDQYARAVQEVPSPQGRLEGGVRAREFGSDRGPILNPKEDRDLQMALVRELLQTGDPTFEQAARNLSFFDPRVAAKPAGRP